ncbi:uncharacterized protein LOC132933338 [Metopolophium dirhodum]|uniref:uncharacterized protein LOC132933338 n=1 Tax=Metopolophium dirhodum TaxID=44670 RepID=UPI0029904F8A|nr:uncharacterized protein LOC132933338 [Metopolophium dirhodum]
MHRARRGHQPSVPSTTREWGAMIISEEWRQRYENTIGNQTRFYQGELVTEGLLYGIMFFNTEIVTTLRQNGINISNVAVDGTFQCLPNHPTDLRQLLTSFPVAYACLTRHTQAAYVCVMRYIFSLELPYSHEVQVITDFETGLLNAIRTVFPEWHQVGCSFHFNQAVLKHTHQIGLRNIIRTNVTSRNIVRLLLALPYLPANGNAYSNVRGFTISDGLMMIRAIAIQQQVFEELRPVFNYFDRYWMGVVGPERFSVHGSDHRKNNFVESFHAYLLGYLGVHPPLWTFYDLIRGVENITRLELSQTLKGQQFWIGLNIVLRTRPSHVLQPASQQNMFDVSFNEESENIDSEGEPVIEGR